MSGRRKRRTQTAEAGIGHDRWLISYADFVTLLFAVFVVLFAYSWQSKQAIRTVSTAIRSGFDSMSAHPSPGHADGRPPLVDQLQGTSTTSKDQLRFDTAKLSRQLQGVLGDAINRHEIVIQQTADGFIISLRELGFFNSGTATLLPGAAEKLQNTARILMQDGLEVRVEGHSDDQPIHNATFQSNWELSTARAMSVLSMLVDQAGFPATKISVAGYGPYHPVASNDTAEGRRSNRRVDLVVLAPRSREEKLH
jgi:chemotaxis protein MotB